MLLEHPYNKFYQQFCPIFFYKYDLVKMAIKLLSLIYVFQRHISIKKGVIFIYSSLLFYRCCQVFNNDNFFHHDLLFSYAFGV